jgi:hypothetical protein
MIYKIGDASHGSKVSDFLAVTGTGEQSFNREERTIKVKGLSPADLQTLSKLREAKVISLMKDDQVLGFGKILDVQEEQTRADEQVFVIRIQRYSDDQFRQITS